MSKVKNLRRDTHPFPAEETPYDIKHVHAEKVKEGMRVRVDGEVMTVTRAYRSGNFRYHIEIENGDYWECGPMYLFLRVTNERKANE